MLTRSPYWWILCAPLALGACESRSPESPVASFCDTYTRVFDREEAENRSEFEKLHPETRAEVEDNLVACFTLCPEKCPE